MSALVPLLVTLPLLGAGVALIFGRRRRVQVGVSIVTLTLVMVIAAVLLYAVDSSGQAIAVSVGGTLTPRPPAGPAAGRAAAGRRGCRINAEPAEGGGFTVYFTIPRR